jgi:ATP-dependent DNA helicase RecG
VYFDKLMVWNYGQQPEDWTVSNLRHKRPSRPFNSDVANALFRAGMIEAWGRGIELIFNACRAAAVPKPALRYEPSGLWMECSFPRQSGEGTTPKTTQETIVAILRSEPSIERRELAKRIGLSLDGIKYHLERLRYAGSIWHAVSARIGHWEVLK